LLGYLVDDSVDDSIDSFTGLVNFLSAFFLNLLLSNSCTIGFPLLLVDAINNLDFGHDASLTLTEMVTLSVSSSCRTSGL
jgi:hypothetical protein